MSDNERIYQAIQDSFLHGVKRGRSEQSAEVERLTVESKCLRAFGKLEEEKVERLREQVRATIDRFQDIHSWQPGESRNALVTEIRDRVDALFARTEPRP